MLADFELYQKEIESGLAKDNLPRLQTISATDLQRADLPPVQFVVEELIPTGLTLIAAAPKFGKSWLVLQMCLAVAAGRPFLGFKTNRAGCLYLALEDSLNRLKGRMCKQLAGEKAPAGFYYSVAANDISNGFFNQVQGFLEEYPGTKLVVVDTLQRVRTTQGRDGYATDYKELGALKRFADSHGIALVLVHHIRKMADDSDAFNRISGTNGVFGAADTAIVLTREKRTDDQTTMNVTGRDVDGTELVLTFNKDMGRWVKLGNADEMAEQRAQREYDESPIVLTIRRLVDESPEWKGTATALLDKGLEYTGQVLADSPRALSTKLSGLDTMLFNVDGIYHNKAKNGNAGYIHSFSKP